MARLPNLRRALSPARIAAVVLVACWLGTYCGLDATAPAVASDSAAVDEAYFQREVRPLLALHCVSCHGADRTEAGLRLDTRDGLLKGGEHGAAVAPGDSGSSLLRQAVGYQSEVKMPPDGALDARLVEILTRWIDGGAPWPADAAAIAPEAASRAITEEDRHHWAFRPVERPSVPAVRDRRRLQSPIDAFILARLEASSLEPASEAEKVVLIRRVTFDLTGLPPTAEEVAAFERDLRHDAYTHLVDRLLASPAFGERWGRHWLDTVRYADARDLIQLPESSDFREIWRYRDWVVRSFNADLSYAEFVRRQLAGDLLQPGDGQSIDRDAFIATGFLALADFVPGDVDKDLMVADYVDDMINVVGQGVLGLTLACARCHDHKFDAITMDDYYGLAGIFFSTSLVDDIPKNPGNTPLTRVVLLTEAEKKERLAQVPANEEAAKAVAAGKTPPDWPQAVVVRDGGPTGTRHEGFQDAHLFARGDHRRPGSRVPRRFPKVLDQGEPLQASSTSGRRELADWVASPRNPLTARVIVNRIWQHHFGEGLVRTVNNFGAMGERPSHPELLDYLADRLVNGFWSLKDLHRQIVLSATYRQSSAGPANAGDPDHRLLTGFPRRRLEAEAVRDALLSAAGLLDRRMEGPAFTDLTTPRRTIYLMSTRTGANTSDYGTLFDRADCGAIVGSRTQSTVAPQALFLMNDPWVRQMAAALAQRSLDPRSEDPTPETRLQRLFRIAFARDASDEEEARVLEWIHAWSADPAADATSDARQDPWTRLCLLLLCSNEFVYLD